MSAVQDVIDRYLTDEGRAPDMALDAAYQLQMTMIRSMLALLDDALKAEGVPPETRLRAVRRLLYGSPWPDEDEARERMREREEAMQALMGGPLPAEVTALLGLPPE